MLNSLDLLIIVFIGMSVVSVLAVLLLFILKSEKLQKGAFYFLAIWGMAIAWLNVQMQPPTMVGEQLLAWALGGLSVIALLLQLLGKGEKRFTIAKILVAVSVVVGMIDAFMF